VLHYEWYGTGYNTNCAARLKLLCCGCCLGHGGAGRLVCRRPKATVNSISRRFLYEHRKTFQGLDYLLFRGLNLSRQVAAAIERRGLLPMYIDIIDGSQAKFCPLPYASQRRCVASGRTGL
jgi:hypothetical protein